MSKIFDKCDGEPATEMTPMDMMERNGRPELMRQLLVGSRIATIVILTFVCPANLFFLLEQVEFIIPALVLPLLFFYLGILLISVIFALVCFAWMLALRRRQLTVQNRRLVCGVFSANAVSLCLVVLIGIGQVAMIPPFVMKTARGTVPDDQCHYNLIQLDSAKEQWALVNHKTDGNTVDENGVDAYIKGGRLHCKDGGDYIYGRVGEPPRCTIYDLKDKKNPKRKWRQDWVFWVWSPCNPKRHCLSRDTDVAPSEQACPK